MVTTIVLDVLRTSWLTVQQSKMFVFSRFTFRKHSRKQCRHVENMGIDYTPLAPFAAQNVEM